MTNYLVNEKGIRTTISDDLFDVLWQSIDGDDEPFTTDGCVAFNSSQTPGEFSTETESEIKPKRKDKKLYNDVLNKKYKESGYFKDYYKEHDKAFECEKCGCKLNSISNRARHQQSKKCKIKEEDIKQKKLEDMIIRRVIGLSA